ncbi:unnamed protein product [Schistosoma mattheei]|uniref:Uncharacterized protein n=1 Tax=Schistosoma mattheei TaxID=31246 RepID=A0A183NL83_9TREM|nr:unnamed protein product [Schistosoma mattheei]
MINMDAFIEAFFAIDQDRSETITIDELQAYMVRNDMEPAFVAVSVLLIFSLQRIILCKVGVYS